MNTSEDLGERFMWIILQDRAEVRRQTVGVDPLGAKTEVASTATPIAAKNKGFQMLAKMGWTSGQALGANAAANSDALIEPVRVFPTYSH